MSLKAEDLQASYDALAEEYTRRIAGELEHKPFDRDQLKRLAAYAKGMGPICDLGCGRHIAAFLREQNADAFSIDLSAGMVEQARRLFPHIDAGREHAGAGRQQIVGGRGLLFDHPHPAQKSPAYASKTRLKPGGILAGVSYRR
jgi:hypothetical protein